MARYRVLRDSPTRFVELNSVDNWTARLQQIVDLEGEDVVGPNDTLLRFGYSKDGSNRAIERTHLTLPLSALARYLSDGIRNGVIPTSEARKLIWECILALAPLPEDRMNSARRDVKCLYRDCGYSFTLMGEDAVAPAVVIACPKCNKDAVFRAPYPIEVPEEPETAQ